MDVIVKTHTQALEEDCSKIEDEVDTGPLLHHLSRSSQDGSTKIGAWIADRSLEAIKPALNIADFASYCSEFVLVIGHDFGKFLLDVVGIFRLASKSCQGLNGFV